MSKEKTYVVLNPWLGVHARGSLIGEADLPASAAEHTADGAIREATDDEIKAGRAEVGVDKATAKQFEAIEARAAEARAANPQTPGGYTFPTDAEAPKAARKAAPAASTTAPAAPASEVKHG